jgi:myo-inositol-1(or 4)-monophosphatase
MNNHINIDPGVLRSIAEQAATQAGHLIKELWNRPRQISSKGYRDIVTDADLASQSLITGLIRERFPDHGFLTEEDDPDLPTSGQIIWIIDPVDGTTNYSRQIPSFCVSISAARFPINKSLTEAEILAGAIYDPMRDELFSAAKGQGSTLNGRTIHVSQTSDLEIAAVGFDWSREYDRRQVMVEVIGRIAHDVHTLRATGSAALALAWVAAGRFDLYFNFRIGPWDMAAAKVIIGEAGGQVSSLLGDHWDIEDSGCIVSNGRLHTTFKKLTHFDELIAELSNV